MKLSTKFFATLMLLFSFTMVSDASVYLKYYNKDSKDYKFKVKIGGSTRTVEFGRSRTSTVTIQGGGETAVIYTNCDEITVHDDDRVIIKNGCITID